MMNRVSIRIEPDHVRHTDFLGVGVNIIPVGLMANNRQQGYTMAHWEMDKKRIAMMKPKVARVWFQVDWMEPEKGVYTWDSPKMLALYKYMDVLRDAGTEVQLNYSWKIGRNIQDWYSIPGLEGRISAPRDLDAFAASCSALLDELITGRGYTNLKYLSFYNEPNGDWDYDAPGDQMAHYAEMMRRVSDKLTADDRRSWVKLWGPEEVDASGSWTRYMKDHADDIIDEYTFHIYGGTYEEFSGQIAARRNYTAPKPVGMTEFGWPGDDDSSWDSGFANYVIKAANEGIHSALIWQLNGVWCEDPDEQVDTNGVYTLWDSLVLGLKPNKSYYAASLLSRYIPAHSTVIYTMTDSPDARVVAFTTEEGDMTIVLEYKGGESREVRIDISGSASRARWSKHVYKPEVDLEPNAIIPPSEQVGQAGGIISDRIDDSYQFIVYTTLAPQTQVEMTPASCEVASGQSILLHARVIDDRPDVIWTVIGEPERAGYISEEGLYTAPSTLDDKLVAVRATSAADSGSYGIALVKIIGSGEVRDG